MAKSMLEWALAYRRKGFSVIPCNRQKRPLIKWAPFQVEKASEQQIRDWWEKWPNANIGVACGAVSGVDVLDLDTEQAYADLQEYYLPDTFQTPAVKSPKGRHLYFRHRIGLSNGVRVVAGTDLRTHGGYVIAPPSINGDGTAYAWIDGLAPKDCAFAEWPDELFAVLLQGSPPSQGGDRLSYNKRLISSRGDYKGGDENKAEVNNVNTKSTLSTFLSEGQRDSDLFHTANCLIRGGCEPEITEKIIEILASQCNPPFPETEIKAKVESAIKRKDGRDKNITADVREFVESTTGNFKSTDIQQWSTKSTKDDLRKISTVLGRLVKEGVIERVPPNHGVFRKVDGTCEELNWKDCDMRTVEMWLPLQMHEWVEIMPGNIILIAGAPNAGKTAFNLNIVRNNMHKYDIHYFNSEMGEQELKKRVMKFSEPHYRDWKFRPKSWPESGLIQDAVVSGEGVINVIDYIEMHDTFYQISGILKDIHNKLKGAIAVISLQKNPGAATGIGGYRSLEKPRLAINIDPGVCKIVKAKNWKTERNPNGRQRQFKLVNGCDIIGEGGWDFQQTE